MNKEEKLISSELIYDGRILKLYNDKVLCPNGDVAYREVTRHTFGAAILAIYDGYIYFERQFRYPFASEVFELPAGKGEKGEEPIVSAIRELEEETGLISKNMEYLGAMYPSPGYTDEVIHLFFSKDNEMGSIKRDKDEFIDIVKLSAKDAYRMLDEGKIVDAKTMIILYKLRDRLLK